MCPVIFLTQINYPFILEQSVNPSRGSIMTAFSRAHDIKAAISFCLGYLIALNSSFIFIFHRTRCSSLFYSTKMFTFPSCPELRRAATKVVFENSPLLIRHM